MAATETFGKRFATASAQQNSAEEMLRRLVSFEPQGHPVISLYLDARANERGRQNFAPFVRKRMTAMKRSFAAHSPEMESFTEDCVRIDRYLEEEPRPSANGVAIFACSAANDFFDVGQFEMPFERNRLMVSDRPHLYPLARLVSQNPSYAVVVADQNDAHIFVFAAGAVQAKRDVQNVDTNEPRWPAFTQNRFQRHENNVNQRHAKQIVETLERTLREEKIDKVILAGDNETILPLLRKQMAKELSDKVIDVVSLGVEAPAHQILEQTLAVVRRHNSLTDAEKVQRLLNEYRADDLAVIGAPQTIAALSNGQVEEVLISTRPEDLAYDDAEVERVLELYRTDDRPLPKSDRRSIADEIVRLAQEVSAARFTFIEEVTRLKQIGGVGALLRYRISADHATPYDASDAVGRTEALVQA